MYFNRISGPFQILLVFIDDKNQLVQAMEMVLLLSWSQ